jgi:hypothetical protein
LIDRAGRFLTVGITWLVIVFGCYFFNVARPGLGTRWVQEQTPPEHASALELDPNGEILAKTASGNIYEIFPGWQQSWEPYGGAEDTNPNGVYCSAGDGSGHIILPPPGNVVSQLNVNCESIESRYYVKVVLLEDGEVWSWSHGSSALANALMPLYLIGAFAIGVVVLVIGGVMKLNY